MKWMMVAVLSVFAVANSVFAVEAMKTAGKATKGVKELVSVSGTVSVQKDDKGEVTGVELTATNGAVYCVTQNVKGKLLAKDDGKQVEAIGVVFEKENKKWMRVKTYKVPAEAK